MKTNLLNNISAVMSKDKRDVSYSPVVNIHYTERDLKSVIYNVEYTTQCKIGVELGMAVQLPEQLIRDDPQSVAMIKNNIGRAIAEEVYGDIRKQLIEAMFLLQKEGIHYNSESMKKLEGILDMVHYD